MGSGKKKSRGSSTIKGKGKCRKSKSDGMWHCKPTGR